MEKKIRRIALLLLWQLIIFGIIAVDGKNVVYAEGEDVVVKQQTEAVNKETTTAAETINIDVSVIYGQTEARAMLEMINEFRTGTADAWFWNEDNETKTVYAQGELGELVYDYNLEQIAMQRAVEIAFLWAHTRPNGEKWHTIEYNGIHAYGENLAAGYKTAEEAFVGLREDDKDYAGQGHRRNMLMKEFTAVGIGHVYYNGYHFWAQEYGYEHTPALEGDMEALESEKTVSVEVLLSKVTGNAVIKGTAANDGESGSGGSNSCILQVGETMELPVVTETMTIDGGWPASVLITRDIVPEWSISDTGVIVVNEEGKLMAVGVGSATLTAKVLDKELIFTINVSGISIESAMVYLDEKYDYNGGEVKPLPGVSLNGEKLKENVDYTLSYKDNASAGIATVIISGIGRYSGSVSTQFTIVVDHEFDDGMITKTPTCLEEGVKTFTCKKCGEKKEELIPKGDHTQLPVAGVPATCISEGKTSGSHCVVCGVVVVEQHIIPKLTTHEWDEGVIAVAPTYEYGGSILFTCKLCGETKTEALAMLERESATEETTAAEDAETQNTTAATTEPVVRESETHESVTVKEQTGEEQQTGESESSSISTSTNVNGMMYRIRDNSSKILVIFVLATAMTVIGIAVIIKTKKKD